MSETTNSHLFALRTTGGQEKVVLRQLEAKMRRGELEVQSVLIVDNLKGYVVIEANDPQVMFMATQGLRHVKGQLRGELEFSEIENYLIKKSTVSELAVDGMVEIIGGPFKGMKATITRVDHEKIEPISVEIKKLINDKKYLEKVLFDGRQKANDIASIKVKKLQEIVGF